MELFYRFVILRHGQSQWNLENRFTGWTEIPLTDQGRQEARQAGKSLNKAGFEFDVAYTSVLDRAIETLTIVQEQLRLNSIPISYSWRLNERHYGCLQGLSKPDTARRLGTLLVMSWRRSYSARPPSLELDDRRHPRFEARYNALPRSELPGTESLEDTEKRLLPLWEQEIRSAILEGKRVLIVAHGNSLRALVRYLERITPADVPNLNIPTGVPILYMTNPDMTLFNRQDLPLD
jgi:2,3-bisphosphoglycerate-dependent phosphoglycerate mutase